MKKIYSLLMAMLFLSAGQVWAQKDIDGQNVLVTGAPDVNPIYTGSPITFNLVIEDDGALLTEGEANDYIVEYMDNTNAGEATITITGKGAYDGSTKTINFTIDEKDIAGVTVTPDPIPDQDYTGSPIEPALTVKDGGTTLEKDKDYTVDYGNANTDVGQVTVTITGKGNYKETKEVTFEIKEKDIAGVTVTPDPIPDQDYTGSPIEPALTVADGAIDLVKGDDKDYIVGYADNTDAGTATITITGKGNYTGTKTVNFTIDPKDIAGATVSPDPIPNQDYTGSDIEPAFTVKDGVADLVEGDDKDYTVGYADNTDAGTATITITGKGNYTGTKTVNFTIVARSIADVTVEAIPNQVATGAAIEPELTIKYNGITLELNTDYTVDAYSPNNTDVGTVTVTIAGTGNFIGNRNDITFEIVDNDIQNATISPIADLPYTGTPKEPVLVVRDKGLPLAKDKDYSVAYSNNTNAGTASVIITGIGDWGGEQTVSFKITAKDITDEDVVVATIPNQDYTGKAIEPALAITFGSIALVRDVDYTASFDNNINIGVATVTIIGMDNYTGVITASFNITQDYPGPGPIDDPVDVSLDFDFGENPEMADCVSTYPSGGDMVVENGDVLTLLVFLDDACDKSDIYLVVNGDTLVPEEKKNELRAMAYTFLIPITGDTKIELVGVEKNDIGIEGIQAGGKIYSTPGHIVVESDLPDSSLRIYTITGQIYLRRQLAKGIATIPVEKGIYLVVLNDLVVKVMVND